MIHTDFEKQWPTFRKKVTYWRPHDYATILLYIKDGSKITYNYDTKRIEYIEVG